MFTYPRVSVVIPTYNRLNFLFEAVDSVLCQTYPSIELIVVDDGSTDGTGSLIRERYGSSLIYLYQENSGVSSARNLGIRHSSSEYISFLDSDDLWDRCKLSYQMDFLMSRSYYGAIYTDEVWLKDALYINQGMRHRKYSGYIYPFCLPLCIISPSSILLKRSLIGRVGFFDEGLPVCEDYDYWLRLTSRHAIYFMDRKLVTKRGGHVGQLSRRYKKMDSFRISSLLKLLQFGGLSVSYEELTRSMLVRKAGIVRQGCLKRGNLEEAGYYGELIREYS